MNLQTIVKIEKPDFRINYDSHLMMIGSCFVENMGMKMEYFCFHTDINPCGIVYNPMSVANTLHLLLRHQILTSEDLCQHNGKWSSFSHHGRFSAVRQEECLQKINDRLKCSSAYLTKTDILIITLGTAWVYRHKASGKVVSNCHKFPAADFERYRLTVAEIVEEYSSLLPHLKAIRPGIKVLFTVSPIRHWKDGAHGNQLSKAVLLLAIDELRQLYDFVSYFPSYEIVMDELRDYRFYGEDMLHISPQGVEYIWEKFRDHYIDEKANPVMNRIDQLNKTLMHRPENPDDVAWNELYQQTLTELEQIKQKSGW